jgi:beta-lysine N6-acetyltransferase
MQDQFETIGNSLIYHGKHSNRIYLMKFDIADTKKLFIRFNELVKKNDYSKIFIKIPSNYSEPFLNSGYEQEAAIPHFYDNSDCVFMSNYLKKERKIIPEQKKIKISNILKLAKDKSKKETAIKIPSNFLLKIIDQKSVTKLAGLYQDVFKSYPFPIFDPSYLLDTMKQNILYFGCYANNELIAASSCEMYPDSKSVEMTDFAVLPNFRGKKIAEHLLSQMEIKMKNQNFVTAYTIARSISHGMNITFSRSGYQYAGTLINNTNIAGNIESMNVWYKHLLKTPKSK